MTEANPRKSTFVLQTIDLSMRLWEINPTNSVVIPQSLMMRSIVLSLILRGCPQEDQTGVTHAISPISFKLSQMIKVIKLFKSPK